MVALSITTNDYAIKYAAMCRDSACMTAKGLSRLADVVQRV